MLRTDSVFVPSSNGAFKDKNILCYSSEEPPAYGSVRLTGKFWAPRKRENPGGFDEYLYFMSNNIWGAVYVDKIDSAHAIGSLQSRMALRVRSTVKQALASIHNEEYRGILQAAFLNDQSDLSTNTKKLFYEAGIYHLLALSGFNIAILASALFAFLFLFPLRHEVKILITLMAVWLYLVFIGFIPSLFRAVVMATIVGISFLAQRKSYLLNSLGIAGITWLVFSPMSIFTPSYQLSFAATFGIITITPILLDSIRLPPMNKYLKAVLYGVFSVASVSTASFIVTLPDLIYYFKQLYLFGLFANIFSVTLMSIAMWISLVGFLFQMIIPGIAAIFMHFAEFSVHLMILGAGLVKFVPWLTMHFSLPYYEPYILFAIVVLGGILIKKDYRKRFYACALVIGAALSLIIVYFHEYNHESQVVFLKMKKSRLAAVQWPDQKAWLIGCGPESPSGSIYQKIILPWMDQRMRCKLNTVVLPRYTQNAVHFLEPLMTQNRGLTIACCDSMYCRDEDFQQFVKNNNGSIVYLKNGEKVAAAPKCSCTVILKQDSDKKTNAAFILRIAKSTIFIRDSEVPAPDDQDRGATIITLRENGAFKEYKNMDIF